MKALEEAIPGVSNAFSILILVMAIYAILGVNLFGPKFPYYFGNFGRAMFTMFQVMTGESWCEAASGGPVKYCTFVKCGACPACSAA